MTEKQNLTPDKISQEDITSILERTIGFINNCDGKSSILLGAYGAALAIVFSGDVVHSMISIFRTAIYHVSLGSILYLLVTFAGLCLGILGLIFLVLVLVARLYNQEEAHVSIDADSKIYFGHIARNKNFQQYRDKLSGTTKEEYLNDLISQTYLNALVCNKKFRYYNRGLKLSMLGFGEFTLFIILGIVVF